MPLSDYANRIPIPRFAGTERVRKGERKSREGGKK